MLGRKPVGGPPCSSASSAARISRRRRGRRVGLNQPRLERAVHVAHLDVVGADEPGELVELEHARVRRVAQRLEPVLRLGRLGVGDQVGDGEPPARHPPHLGELDVRVLEVVDGEARDRRRRSCRRGTAAARRRPARRARWAAPARWPCSSIARVASSATTARTCGASRRATWPVPAATSSTRSSAVSGRRSNSHSESVVNRRLKRGSSNAAACCVNDRSRASPTPPA